MRLIVEEEEVSENRKKHRFSIHVDPVQIPKLFLFFSLFILLFFNLPIFWCDLHS